VCERARERKRERKEERKSERETCHDSFTRAMTQHIKTNEAKGEVGGWGRAHLSSGRRGGGLGSRPIFKKFNEPYAPS